MDKTRQPTQSETGSGVTPVKFWGTIVASTLASLLIIYYLINIIRRPASFIGYVAIGLFLLFLATAIFSIILTIRGHQEQGITIAFYAGLATSLTIVAVFQGRTLSASGSYLVIGLIIIFWLLPEKAKRRNIILLGAAELLMWVMEWINPPWRMASEALKIGPVAAIILGIVLIILGVRQAIIGNIRTKLIVTFVVITVLALGISGILNQRSYQASLTTDIGNKLTELSNTRGVEIATAIDRDRDMLKTLSMSVSLQNAARAANETFPLSQADINRLEHQWQAANAADNNADPLVSGVLNNEISTQLRDFQNQFQQHIEVSLTGTQGVTIASTNRTSDYNQADKEWWQTAYRDNIYIGQPEYDANSRTVTINMAITVREHGNGRIVGILRTIINLTNVTDMLKTGIFGQTGRTIILLPSGEQIRLNAVGDGSFELIQEEAPPELLALSQSAFGYQTVSLNGTPTLASIASVLTVGEPYYDTRVISNLAWQVVTLQDEAEALQPVTTQTRSALITGVIIMLAGIIAAIGVARFISDPIIRLNTFAGQVAAGDLTVEAKVETRDEVGALATTFNSMTARLRELIGTLESRVTERTQSLELAAEVGRSVSQVRALDVMLTEAAELIRSRFNLYYVQVYLTDSRQMNLILQSGTGTVGAELLGRGHRLPLNTASINGRAAIEKRSVVVEDTAASATFKPNPLLPDTHSEMAVPLLIGDKVVGVLDLQSREAGALNEDTLTAFEALAGQLAIAIQNATFLAETQQARAEVESQARRLTRANWADYLDAIHQPEETGFVFEQNKIAPLTGEEPVKDNALVAPITVTGEALGNLIVEMEGGSPIARTKELVNTVAQQVARQIESLRLLDSAERYRFEAEQASRLLTREGWQDYTDANADKGLSYIYDLKEVRTYHPIGYQQAEESAFNLPLKVRDETVGRLVVQGLEEDNSEALELANAVAERLGAHIERLRLSKQTQQALKTTQEFAQRERSLRQITSAVRGSTDPATILRSAARELGTLLGRKTIVRLAIAGEAQDSQPHPPVELAGEAIANNEDESAPAPESPKADGGNE